MALAGCDVLLENRPSLVGGKLSDREAAHNAPAAQNDLPSAASVRDQRESKVISLTHRNYGVRGDRPVRRPFWW